MPTEVRDGVATVALTGDIDLVTTGEIEHAVADVLTCHPLDEVVLDLADVVFMDSTGLRMLWSIRQMAQQASARLVLRTPSDAVMRLLRLTGMHRIFQIEARD
jgi:anti-sigma B factor antagonist